MSLWQRKFYAASLHFLVTALIAALAGYLVFLVWYPWPYYQMLGGTELFVLVVLSDLALGPLLTLVVFTPKKPLKVLLGDYAVIGTLQLAALMYGLHTVAAVRPVFLVFAVDGFEVVLASDLSDEDLEQAIEPVWRTRGWGGPRQVWAELPTDGKERTALVFSSLAGKDLQMFPKYYRPMTEAREEILARGGDIAQLAAKWPSRRAEIDSAIESSGRSQADLVWYPVRHFKGFWTVLVARSGLAPVAWIPMDPY